MPGLTSDPSDPISSYRVTQNFSYHSFSSAIFSSDTKIWHSDTDSWIKLSCTLTGYYNNNKGQINHEGKSWNKFIIQSIVRLRCHGHPCILANIQLMMCMINLFSSRLQLLANWLCNGSSFLSTSLLQANHQYAVHLHHPMWSAVTRHQFHTYVWTKYSNSSLHHVQRWALSVLTN